MRAFRPCEQGSTHDGSPSGGNDPRDSACRTEILEHQVGSSNFCSSSNLNTNIVLDTNRKLRPGRCSRGRRGFHGGPTPEAILLEPVEPLSRGFESAHLRRQSARDWIAKTPLSPIKIKSRPQEHPRTRLPIVLRSQSVRTDQLERPLEHQVAARGRQDIQVVLDDHVGRDTLGQGRAVAV